MPFDSPARVQTRRGAAAAAAAAAHSNGQQHAAGEVGIVAQRQLGSIGGRSGPGYSPYARRIASRAAQYDRGNAVARASENDRSDDDDDDGDDDDGSGGGEGAAEVPRQSTGLFGKVKSLPGRMLGLLSRSSSRQTLSGSTSLADVRAELDQELARAHEQQQQPHKLGGLPRSRTTHQLAPAPAAHDDAGSARGARPRLAAAPALPASSSLSALSALSYGAPARTAHSKLNLPLAGTQRAASPSAYSALTTSTHAGTPHARPNRNRSPSPLRNGLAGSMSSFQLARPSTLGDSAAVNPFGLQSRSPFTASAIDSPRRHHAGSESFYAANRTGPGAAAGGHPLFPYSSNLPRGTSPALSGSFSMRDGLSTLGGGTPSAKRTFASRMAHGGVASAAAAAAASPLGRGNHLHASRTVSGGLSDLAGADDVEMLSGPPSDSGSADRARKRQLVWDPERGLVSRAKLEQEKARCARGVLSPPNPPEADPPC